MSVFGSIKWDNWVTNYLHMCKCLPSTFQSQRLRKTEKQGKRPRCIPSCAESSIGRVSRSPRYPSPPPAPHTPTSTCTLQSLHWFPGISLSLSCFPWPMGHRKGSHMRSLGGFTPQSPCNSLGKSTPTDPPPTGFPQPWSPKCQPSRPLASACPQVLGAPQGFHVLSNPSYPETPVSDPVYPALALSAVPWTLITDTPIRVPAGDGGTFKTMHTRTED